MSKPQLLKLLNACFYLIFSHNGGKEEGCLNYRLSRRERETHTEREREG